MKNILSIADLEREEILAILKKAEGFKKNPPKNILQGAVLASCFFEPSTRTRLSFETAMRKLGGSVIGFADGNTTSAKKGESLYDSIRVIGGYADVIAIRHPLEGSARRASEATDKPVINAGDGANQHPTQTLLDLFTIKECHRKLNGLKIAMVGDLKFGRTVHSLALACALFDMQLYFVSPPQLALPDYICRELRKKGIKFSFHHAIEDVVDKVDILYMTRIQKERLDEAVYEKIKGCYVLNEKILEKAQKKLKVMHPLPRVDEIDTAVDLSPHAYYFQQSDNGLYVRQALLALLLRK